MKQKNIEIFPYNSEWPKIFDQEAEIIKNLLGSSLLTIEHIGSTAVIGMHAKPVIDILCVVSFLSSSKKLQEIYIDKGELNLPMRYFFSRKELNHTIHIHVVEPHHSFISLSLKFRNYLIEHKDAREEYNQLKANLLKYPNSYIKKDNKFSGYNLGKNIFIKQILRKANFQDLMIVFCMHNQEWDIFNQLFDVKAPHCLALYKGYEIIGSAAMFDENINIKLLRNKELEKEFYNLIKDWQTSSVK